MKKSEEGKGERQLEKRECAQYMEDGPGDTRMREYVA